MKKVFTLIVFCLLTVISCTEDFEQLNTNNNQPESVTPSLLLPTVIFDLADLTVNQNYLFAQKVSQYTANYEFNDIDIFDWTSDDRYWSLYSILQDVEDIENYGIENQSVNHEAIALILSSYAFSVLTDVYGDVPYSEANKAIEDLLAPKYDEQSMIYNDILANLKRANEIINIDQSVEGDIMFQGDMVLWKKFANSLRLRLLLRSSNVQDNQAEIQSIVNKMMENPIIESNNENAVYYYSGNIPDANPYSNARGRDYDYYLGIPTTHIIDQLQNFSDPRLNAWFDPIPGTTSYLGTAPGQNLGDVGRPNEFSSKAASFFEEPDKLPAIFITASEVHFILAELAQLGLIAEDPKMYYDQAIKFSFEEWGLEIPEGYLENNAVYNSTSEIIHIQKWISLYYNPLQAWMHWKRTALPSFIEAGPGTINNGQFPVRLMYPALEQSVNESNYQAAANNIGGDNINSRVWWDK